METFFIALTIPFNFYKNWIFLAYMNLLNFCVMNKEIWNNSLRGLQNGSTDKSTEAE